MSSVTVRSAPFREQGVSESHGNDDSAETLRLLAAAAAGDSASLSALLQRHHAWLTSYVEARIDPRIRSRADASDVVQETQGEVCVRVDDFLQRRPTSFRAWMLKTAYDRLGKLRRRHVMAKRRSVLHETPLEDRSWLPLAKQFVAPQEEPWQRLSREELAARVQRALGRLCEPDRELLLLRCVQGLDNQEIGHLLKASAKTVSKRYGRALRCLLEQLPAAGFDRNDL